MLLELAAASRIEELLLLLLATKATRSAKTMKATARIVVTLLMNFDEPLPNVESEEPPNTPLRPDDSS